MKKHKGIPTDDPEIDARLKKVWRFVEKNGWSDEQVLHTFAAVVFRMPSSQRKMQIAWLKDLLVDLEDTKMQRRRLIVKKGKIIDGGLF